MLLSAVYIPNACLSLNGRKYEIQKFVIYLRECLNLPQTTTFLKSSLYGWQDPYSSWDLFVALIFITRPSTIVLLKVWSVSWCWFLTVLQWDKDRNWEVSFQKFYGSLTLLWHLSLWLVDLSYLTRLYQCECYWTLTSCVYVIWHFKVSLSIVISVYKTMNIFLLLKDNLSLRIILQDKVLGLAKNRRMNLKIQHYLFYSEESKK